MKILYFISLDFFGIIPLLLGIISFIIIDKYDFPISVFIIIRIVLYLIILFIAIIVETTNKHQINQKWNWSTVYKISILYMSLNLMIMYSGVYRFPDDESYIIIFFKVISLLYTPMILLFLYQKTVVVLKKCDFYLIYKCLFLFFIIILWIFSLSILFKIIFSEDTLNFHSPYFVSSFFCFCEITLTPIILSVIYKKLGERLFNSNKKKKAVGEHN